MWKYMYVVKYTIQLLDFFSHISMLNLKSQIVSYPFLDAEELHM